VGKEKRVDVYLEVRKRRGHIFLNETSACAFSVIVIPFNMKIQSLSLFPYHDTNVNNIELQYTIGVIYKMRNSYANNLALLLIFSFF
jgi:hypothetical protein